MARCGRVTERTTAARPDGVPPTGRSPRRLRRPGALETLVFAVLAVVVAQQWLVPRLDAPALQTWATIFVSICVQALPFLVAGVLVSGAIAAYVPPELFHRVLPRRPALAVPVAGMSGVVVPGCECASVPIAGSLVARGVTPAAAFAFLLAAPAINPIVLVATAVAFPGQPEMVLGRFLASLMVAVLMGWLWVRFGRTDWLRPPRRHSPEGTPPFEVFRRAAQHDFLHAGGFLVVGGIVAASVNVLVPSWVVEALAERWWLAVLALALLAVVVAICSEADAFVAASFTQFSRTAQLAFMVVGPAVDVKLIALQAGTFGKSFALRFAPITFVVAVGTTLLVGWWLL
jgi:uncharacterized protein